MVSHAEAGWRARYVAVVVAALIVASGPAHAQDASKAAEREYRLGFQALEKGNCTRALVHYRRSFELAPRPRTLFNMAACQEDLGQEAEAWDSYQTFLALAEARDAKIVEKARVRIEVLRGRLRGQVWLDTVPSGATVQIDGERESRGLTPVTLSLSPGVHLVRLSMPDAVAVERSVEVTPGGVSSLSVALALPSAISILVEPVDAVIEAADGGSSTQGRFEAAVKPGRHEFTVRRDGYLTDHVVIDAVAGRTYEQRVRLRPVLTPGRQVIAPDENVTVERDLPPRPSGTRRAVGWTVAGLGIVGVAAGGVVGVVALRDVASPVPGHHDRGKDRSLVADGLFVVGAIALVVAWRLLRGGSPPATVQRAREPAR